MPHRTLTVSLPVRDLARSREFFTRLGFELDPRFTGDQAAALVINGETSVMLATRPLFKTLTEREICDTSTHLQALLAVSCERRTEVDKLVRLAVENGGQAAGEPQDHGFMYDWSFYDLDGHGWGVFCMGEGTVPA